MGKIKHGMCTSPTYRSWRSMKNRCYNKNNKDYSYYGGRGIVVCNSWLESFNNFFGDMGERPEGFTLDRIDNNGNYEPDNCRWASRHTQRINNSQIVEVRYRGEKYNLCELVEKFNLKRSVVYERICCLGWSAEAAIELPTRVRGLVVKYEGRYFTLVGICKELDINKNTAFDRLRYTDKTLFEIFNVDNIEVYSVSSGIIEEYIRKGKRDRSSRYSKA